MPLIPEPKFAQVFQSDHLNSVVLFGYFMGMYSMTFFGCIYIYKFKESNPSPVVMTILFALFAVGTAQLGIRWYLANEAFITNGVNWEQEVTSPNGGVLSLLKTSLSTVGYTLDNFLLIWRCYHVVGKSVNSMIVPFFLFFCQIVLSICNLAYMSTPAIIYDLVATIHQVQIVNLLNASAITVTVVTSLATTYITYRRIASSTKKHIQKRHRYQRILTIIIESSAIYLVASVFNAVIQIMHGIVILGGISTNLNVLVTYSAIASIFTTGFAPTLMVAQLGITATNSDTEKSSEALSTLQFQQRPLRNRQDQQSSEMNSDSSMSRRVLSAPCDVAYETEEVV